MALSEYEKKILAEMEQHLRQQDPELADAMASAVPSESAEAPAKAPLSPRRIALGSILAATGLGIVLVGVTVGFSVLTVVLGAAGFLMMVGGVLYALSTESGGKKLKKTGADGPRSGAPAAQSPHAKGPSRAQQRRKRWDERG